MRTRAVLVGLLGAMVLTACGGDAKSSAQLGASTTSTTETPTTLAPTTTAAPATTVARQATTTVRPPPTTVPCPLAAIGAGATNVTAKPGDFDGNGVADTLRAYKLGTDWHLRVELAGAASGHDVVVPGIDPGTGLKAVGGFNVGGNPVDEAFAVVGGGASTTIVGLFVFANCQLTPVTENGNATSYAVGASAQRYSGLKCVAGTALQVLSATAAPSTGTPFTAVRTNYDLVGRTVVQAGAPTQQTLANNDPQLAPFSRFDCGGLTLS